MEQRMNLKFLVKLRKIPTECFKLLKEVYVEDMMSRTQIFEWHKYFEKGHEEEDGMTFNNKFDIQQPFKTKTDENITKVKQLV